MDYIAQQQTGEWLASRMIGKNVENSSGEELGHINDVIVSENGEVAGAVIGVGGFLGIGEKNVAVPFETISTAMKGDDESVVVLNATKEELQAAPDYTDLEGQPLSVTKQMRDKASETYKQAKDSVAGDESSEEVTTTQ
jgi:sporulation protein YlmC with PRC-barrel domain